MLQSNDEYVVNFIANFKEIFYNRYSNQGVDALLNLNASDYHDIDFFDNDISSIKTDLKSIMSRRVVFYDAIKKSYDDYLKTESFMKKESGMFDGGISVGISSGSSSTSYSSSAYSPSSSSSTYVSKDISSDSTKSDKEKEVNKVDVDALIANVLNPFGVTKENFDKIVKADGKSDYDYEVFLKNGKTNEKWNSNDIKQYYIKDNEVVAVMLGDGTIVKVEDGKLVLDESKSSDFAGTVMSGVGATGGYFASKTVYNNDSNKAIFNSVYSDATDDEYKNFCESITKNGEQYDNAAKNVIEDYKNNITSEAKSTDAKNGNIVDNSVANSENNVSVESTCADVEESGTVSKTEATDTNFKIDYNKYLTIEDNAVKVDSKSLATELYAEASKINGVSFKDGISTEVTFNDSVASQLAEYLNTKYSMNVDASVLMGASTDVATVSSASDVAQPTIDSATI